MVFVLDASVAASWAFDDEDHPVAAAALQRLRQDSAVVPAIWWYELRNIVVVNERRGRLTESLSAAFLTALRRLPITVLPPAEDALVLALARGHKLSACDAAYLALAREHTAELATLDAALARAARTEGVAVMEA